MTERPFYLPLRVSILIKHIKGLVQAGEHFAPRKSGLEMASLPLIEDAFLLIDGEIIKAYGPMTALPECYPDQEIDASGRFVLPSFVDSHTHIVFAGSREGEFVDKIKGLSYREIAQKGGGILNSAKLLQNTSEDALFEQSMTRVRDVIRSGTGALEIKSGYGLTVKDEIKMLKVAKRIKEATDLTVKTTFLGAHAVPSTAKTKRDYINLVIQEMIPQVAEQRLADYCDVFCEEGFFTEEESLEILEAGLKYQLKPKVHANQLALSGGVQAGVRMKAISVDHLETIGDAEIESLKNAATIATLLPGAAFFLRMQYPPARKMMEEGLSLALGTDFNPGSAPSGNMSLILSLACIQMKMLPEEAINAATINGAYAMEVGNLHGTITTGKLASVIITKPIPSYAFIPYAFGADLVETVILKGKIQ